MSVVLYFITGIVWIITEDISFSHATGADINILAELVSSLPHTPPPSLLRASALGMLLMVRFQSPVSVAVCGLAVVFTSFFYHCLTYLVLLFNLVQDPRNPASDFINVVTVHREEEGEESKFGAAAARAAARECASSVVQGALHSLRIIAQLTQ